ncbi:MAG: leucine-rich repeat domain-containing protein [Eubacteriales bacterium]|jgi:hypothetical protein|nr:leucine-rich repeat domain-containing protein [Eubacteriales bacterium]
MSKKSRPVYLLLAILICLVSCAKEEERTTSTTTTSALPESRLVSSSSDRSFSYDVYKDYAEITAYIGSGAVVTVPATYQDTAVVSIGKNAFYGNTTVTSVTLPPTVLNIANKAFAKCSSLTEIIMPGVKAIGMEAFRGTALASVNLPAVLENFGKYALADTPLVTVSLPASIIRSGDYIFAGCKTLTGVVFPETMNEITVRMFYNCASLTEVIIPPQITKIGGYAFSACGALTKLYVPATVTDIGEGLLYNSPNAVIVTEKGSAADTYAKNNKITCVYETFPIQ